MKTTITDSGFKSTLLGAGGNNSPSGVRGMIFAAGLGTRLKPFTDKHPKALAIVNGKSLLQRNVEYLQQHSITDVIVNVHHFADQIIEIINYNNGWGSNISISDEKDAILETGGGLKRAAWYFEGVENFVVMNADILTDLDLSFMIKQHINNKPLASLATTNRASSRYFLFDDNGYLCGWTNEKIGEERISKPSSSMHKKAFSGIQIINQKLLPLITQVGKFSIVDVYLEIAKTHTIQGFDHSGSKFIDVGKPENIVLAESMFD
ncbi:MAG: NTP transferase domain-containing protein [Pedobacter sp.]|nr:NTP transferase domain-containing protein [Chitinophagaceae bacterium]